MMELIEGLPDGVVGIEAVGEVTADDYETVAKPAIEKALAERARIRLIHVLGDRVAGHTPGALLDDAKLGISHLDSFERVAVVTDIDLVRALVKTGGWSIPGETRLFSTDERAAAIAWAGAGLGAEE